MPGSIVIITYNDLVGVPRGRHVSGRVIVYSGDYGRSKYTGIDEIKKDLLMDAELCDEIYVYVGNSMMNGARKLIRDLMDRGKLVHIIACYCDAERKRAIVRDMGDISWIEAECGGRQVFANLIAQHSN